MRPGESRQTLAWLADQCFDCCAGEHGGVSLTATKAGCRLRSDQRVDRPRCTIPAIEPPGIGSKNFLAGHVAAGHGLYRKARIDS